MAVPQVADLGEHPLGLGSGLRERGDGAPGAGERDEGRTRPVVVAGDTIERPRALPVTSSAGRRLRRLALEHEEQLLGAPHVAHAIHPEAELREHAA